MESSGEPEKIGNAYGYSYFVFIEFRDLYRPILKNDDYYYDDAYDRRTWINAFYARTRRKPIENLIENYESASTPNYRVRRANNQDDLGFTFDDVHDDDDDDVAADTAYYFFFYYFSNYSSFHSNYAFHSNYYYLLYTDDYYSVSSSTVSAAAVCFTTIHDDDENFKKTENENSCNFNYRDGEWKAAAFKCLYQTYRKKRESICEDNGDCPSEQVSSDASSCIFEKPELDLSDSPFNEKLELRSFNYDDFKDIKYIGEGGFSTISSASLVDHSSGRITKVALKELHNSQQMSGQFQQEIKSLMQCNRSPYVVRLYGTTKNPATNNHIIVMEYIESGSLRNYLRENFDELTWQDKLRIAARISEGLAYIHARSLVHRDLHSGNILQKSDWAYISDLGLCGPADKSPLEGKQIYGSMPYIAPEILRGENHTQRSDIYSLGIVMWELATGELPFSDRAHDYNLAFDICNGVRPKIPDDTPVLFVELMERCWDADIGVRPTAREVYEALIDWEKEIFIDPTSEVSIQFKENRRHEISMQYQVVNDSCHPNAIYTSRVLNDLYSVKLL